MFILLCRILINKFELFVKMSLYKTNNDCTKKKKIFKVLVLETSKRLLVQPHYITEETKVQERKITKSTTS